MPTAEYIKTTKAQNVAGTVLEGIRQPELTPDQVRQIIGSTGSFVNQALLDLTRAQTEAGTVVDGVRKPKLTPDQVRQIIELNTPSRH